MPVELFVNGGVWHSLLVLLTGNVNTDAVLPVGPLTEVALGEP